MQYALPCSQHRDLEDVINTKSQEGYDATTTAPGPTTTNPMGDPRDIELILDVLFIFMSGIAIIVGLIILVYVVVVLFDRYCGCGGCLGWNEEEDYPAEGVEIGPSAGAYGPVAYKARLWGLTSQEREAVLKQLFAQSTTHYFADPIRSSPSAQDSTFRSPCASSTHHFLEFSSASSVTSSNQRSIDVEVACSSPSAISRREKRDSEGRTSFINEKAHAEDAAYSSIDSQVLDERRLTTTTCAICLCDYDDGDKVLHGISCSHLFHYDCILTWMEKRHDHCPYCRVEMMSPKDMRRAAQKVLSKQRLKELSWAKRRLERDVAATAAASRIAPGMTSSPLLNVSDAVVDEIDGNDPAITRDLSNNIRATASPARSDDVQVGITVMAPARDRVGSSDLSPMENGIGGNGRDCEESPNAAHPREQVREALDLPLASSLDERLAACVANSADA